MSMSLCDFWFIFPWVDFLVFVIIFFWTIGCRCLSVFVIVFICTFASFAINDSLFALGVFGFVEIPKVGEISS